MREQKKRIIKKTKLQFCCGAMAQAFAEGGSASSLFWSISKNPKMGIRVGQDKRILHILYCPNCGKPVEVEVGKDEEHPNSGE